MGREFLPITVPSFGLTSEQCELLLAFEAAGSMSGLAEVIGRDISVVSRQLQRISEMAPVLEKQRGKWCLSQLGRQINLWTRDASESQKRILSQQSVLRVASTREFAARILAPQLPKLLGQASGTIVTVLTSERGIEHLLLKGKADLGFDCGRPQDPLIRFKTAAIETFAVVATPRFLEEHNVKHAENLLMSPHLRYKRATAPRLLQLEFEVPCLLASFDDIASIREACCAHLGWAVLPVYAVRREIASGVLKEIPGWKIQHESFGVWWMRGRLGLEPWVTRALNWLREQELT